MAAKKKNAGVALWKRESAWDRLEKNEESKLEIYCQDYIDFISEAKTERLVFSRLLELAQSRGFRDLDAVNATGGKLKAGDAVYRQIDGKTIMLLRVGKSPLQDGLNLVGGHGDCPRLDLKPCPLYQDEDFVLLDTHYYGGIKKYQWVTIPLALYGVVVRRDGSKVEIAIGDNPGDPVFTITDILPHLDRDQATKPMDKAIDGEQLNVLFGSRPASKDDCGKDECKDLIKLNILRMLADRYGIEEEDFGSAELEVVPAGRARDLGFDRSMILGYGQDDRICSYAAARAILDFDGIPGRTMGALICDKEEIGSYGRTGMDSVFLANTVAELVAACSRQYSDLTVRRALENTRMISADVGALADPGYKNTASPNNQARINCGITLSKYDGARGKSGSSDASAELVGKVRKCFNDAKVAWQMSELGRVDVGGGGTIALYMARYGIQVIDCGVGLLCMHAPWEVAGKLDTYMAYKAYSAFASME